MVSVIWTIPAGFVWVTTSLISPSENGLAGPKKGKASSLVCRGIVPIMLIRSPFVTGLLIRVPFSASSFARSLLPSSAGASIILVAGLVSAFLTFTYSPRLLPVFCLTSPSMRISPVLLSSGGPYITIAPVALCPFISIMSPEDTSIFDIASGSMRTIPLPAFVGLFLRLLILFLAALFRSSKYNNYYYLSFISFISVCRRFNNPNSSSMKDSRLDMDSVKYPSISWNSLSPEFVK